MDISHEGFVPPELNEGAQLMIVGEAPGADEVYAQRPFVGASGRFLEGALRVAGLVRKDFNVFNVVPWRPPRNEIDQWFPKGEPNELVQEGVRRLHEAISQLRPRAILAVGNTALWALTGHRGITHRRGSMYPVRSDDLGVKAPLLATLHPAAILREPSTANLFARDLARFGQLARGEISADPPVRQLVLWPTGAVLDEVLDRCLSAPWFAADIETGGGRLQCLGVSPEPGYSVCIPADTPERIGAIQRLLASDVPKIFHHAPYDVPYLRYKAELTVNGQIHDTLAMAQAMHPEMPRDLGTLTSLYTLQPYYKDMGVLWKENADVNMYWRYNALDAACTMEIAEVLRRKLQQNNLWQVYERTQRVLPHAFDMSIRGIKYDGEEAARLSARLTTRATRYQLILDHRAETTINVNSSQQVSALLYGKIGLPKQYARKSKSVTTGQSALLNLYATVKDRRVRQVIRSIIHIRHAKKLRDSYCSIPHSDDGRMRSSFNPAGTETGRWSASKFLITEGVNLQTVTQEWKSCFVADDGMLLWNADYSQIEARLVSYLANDARSIAIFESGGDIHKENASVIFHKPVDQITKRERDIGKTVHALNYGVGVDTLVDFVNKRALETGIWLDSVMGKYVRETYLNNFDQVVRWQEWTWEEVQKTRMLTNPFGRRRIFTGPLYGIGSEHTKLQALAFIPQSIVPDLLNEALIDLRINPPVPGFEVLLNIHDALFGQGPIETAHLWLPRILSSMQRPISLPSRTSSPSKSITIPVDLQVGTRWSQLMKLPTNQSQWSSFLTKMPTA